MSTIDSSGTVIADTSENRRAMLLKAPRLRVVIPNPQSVNKIF
jgi:hypothetical protein